MIWTGIIMGLAGTLAMDIWALVLERFGLARGNWAMPGRWLGHVFRGKVFHDNIGKAEPVPKRARALGWALHYGVGVIYGVVFVLIMGAGWLANPTFMPVWIFSILTIVAGWFLPSTRHGAGLGRVQNAGPLVGAEDGTSRAYGVCGGDAFGCFGIAPPSLNTPRISVKCASSGLQQRIVILGATALGRIWWKVSETPSFRTRYDKPTSAVRSGRVRRERGRD